MRGEFEHVPERAGWDLFLPEPPPGREELAEMWAQSSASTPPMTRTVVQPGIGGI